MKNTIKFLFIFQLFWVQSQVTQKFNSTYTLFYNAEELFQKEQYAAARIEFRSFINQNNQLNDPYYIKALYYEGISALELYNNDAIKLLEK